MGLVGTDPEGGSTPRKSDPSDLRGSTSIFLNTHYFLKYDQNYLDFNIDLQCPGSCLQYCNLSIFWTDRLSISVYSIICSFTLLVQNFDVNPKEKLYFLQRRLFKAML